MIPPRVGDKNSTASSRRQRQLGSPMPLPTTHPMDELLTSPFSRVSLGEPADHRYEQPTFQGGTGRQGATRTNSNGSTGVGEGAQRARGRLDGNPGRMEIPGATQRERESSMRGATRGNKCRCGPTTRRGQTTPAPRFVLAQDQEAALLPSLPPSLPGSLSTAPSLC